MNSTTVSGDDDWRRIIEREKKSICGPASLPFNVIAFRFLFFFIIMFSCTNAPRAESLFLPRTRKRSYGRQTFEQMI